MAGGTLVIFPLLLWLLPGLLKLWPLLALLTVRWSWRQAETLREWWRHRRWAQLVPEERRELRRLADLVATE